MADKERTRRLHIFDLDGTLIRGSAATVEISRQLGLLEEIGELERELIARRIGSPEYAERVHALWSDLTQAHVAAAFEAAPWLAGIQEVWREIREGGDYCAVISLSPSFLRGATAELGSSCGARLALSRVAVHPASGPVGHSQRGSEGEDRGPAVCRVRGDSGQMRCIR
jgi:hypothetical protein